MYSQKKKKIRVVCKNRIVIAEHASVVCHEICTIKTLRLPFDENRTRSTNGRDMEYFSKSYRYFFIRLTRFQSQSHVPEVRVRLAFGAGVRS